MRFLQITGLSISIFILSTKNAHAYLEPGSGSYLLQLFIGGGVGGLFVIKTFWLQIKSFIATLLPWKNKRKNPENSVLKKKNGK